MRRYIVAFSDTATPESLAGVRASIGATGMDVTASSCDYVLCEGGWLASVRLRALANQMGWNCAQASSQASPFAAFVFTVCVLVLMVASLYGAITFVRCFRDYLGPNVTIPQATMFAIVSWLGLYGLLNVSKPR